MNRRTFLCVLAALPMVGRYFQPSAEAAPKLATVEQLTSGTTDYTFYPRKGKTVQWYRYDFRDDAERAEIESWTVTTTIDGE